MDRSRILGVIGKIPLVGAALRAWARRYPDGSVTTIRSGVAAGLRWRRYRRFVSGYWLGHYELPIQHALKRELKPGDTFFDVGANAGFFTLVAARIVGATGRCVAFEPWPTNHQSIREQLILNSLDNCTAAKQAIAEFDGSMTFSSNEIGSAQGHIGAGTNGEKSIEAEVVTLDTAIRLYGNPHFVKMDIEGAEVGALRGARQTLQQIRPVFLIELHGPECEAGATLILKNARYTLFDLEGKALDPAMPIPQHILARPLAA